MMVILETSICRGKTIAQGKAKDDNDAQKCKVHQVHICPSIAASIHTCQTGWLQWQKVFCIPSRKKNGKQPFREFLPWRLSMCRRWMSCVVAEHGLSGLHLCLQKVKIFFAFSLFSLPYKMQTSNLQIQVPFFTFINENDQSIICMRFFCLFASLLSTGDGP